MNLELEILPPYKSLPPILRTRERKRPFLVQTLAGPVAFEDFVETLLLSEFSASRELTPLQQWYLR